jgi:hypothetical protein
MKLVRILVLILCACFGSLAWGQQAPCPPQTPWVEFHRYSMQRWNPCETVLIEPRIKNVIAFLWKEFHNVDALLLRLNTYAQTKRKR